METITNIKTNEEDNLIIPKTTTGYNFFKAPSPTHLVIYLLCFLIVFLILGVSLHWILDYENTNEQWIKNVKLNQENDQYFRHPKY